MQKLNKSNEVKYFLYRRKSTDDERQVLSLDSQRAEVLKRFPNIKIVELLPESVSAHKPYKRPVFKEMIERLQKGEAQGVVAWHPDRLSRNPIDAAQIIYLLDVGLLKDLKFCSYGFENTPEGKMFLQITMSQSKYSSDKLSKDVKRGINKKADTGWRPGQAPLGYQNSKVKLKGQQDISNDSERFYLVKQVFQTMLTGNYTAPKLLKYANDELGLRLPATKKLLARKLRISHLYRILSNPFYYGWYEWVAGSGNWIKGNHEAMITEKEFDHIQFLLGRKGRPRPKEHKFAFTGLMRCGHCGAMITAEEKFKHQKNGKTHHYIYYRCTRRKDPDCEERAIEIGEFNRQIDEAIQGLTIPERFEKWALAYLHELRTTEANSREESLASKQVQYERTINQIDNLLLKYASPENANGELMSENEYTGLRSKLLKTKNDLFSQLNQQDKEIEKWVELSERTFNFARYARIWFAKGDIETKRAIFACLGSDLILKSQKVAIKLRKPFEIMFEGLPKAEEELDRLEPLNNYAIAEQMHSFGKKFPLLSG